MRLTLHLTLVLASIVLVLSSVADAVPVRHNTNGMVTMPIRSLHGRNRKDLHPQLYLQQHINRAERRLARMTGRVAPSDDHLRAQLHKRMHIVGNGPIKSGHLRKRYFRPTAMIDKFRQKAKTEKAKAKSSKKLKGAAASNGVAGGGAATAGNTATDAGSASANATTAAGGNAAAGNGQGVDPIDIQAALDNTLTNAVPPSADSSIGLDIEGPDTGYLAQVQLGTPPRKFEILMDSGSADFWVGAENCQSEAGGGCGNHQFLGNQTSSSFVDSGKPFNVTYGTGEVAGNIVQDNLNLAGLKLKAHVFGTAQLESVEFSSEDTKFDGLMGLAQSGLSQQQTPTPVEALVAQGLIKDAITSYKISRLADQKNDGEITFGGLDQTKFDGKSLVVLPNVNAQGFWEGAMDAVTVDGQDTGLQDRTAILDTGTTLIVAPPDDVAAVHKLITGAKSDGQGGFTIPCTTTQSVALSFGKQEFTIDPRDLAALPVDPSDPAGDCISGISSGNVGGATEWLVGDVFLKNAYFSTDVQKNTVSLAKLV